MQQKNTVKTGGVFHISKGYFGDNLPLQTAKNPLKSRWFCHQKRDIFDTQSTVRCENLSTPDGTMYLQKPIFYSGEITFCLPSSSS